MQNPRITTARSHAARFGRVARMFHARYGFPLACLVAVGLSGCRCWPWRPGPVPESVATCRDLSGQALGAIERGQWQDAEGLLDRAVQSCPIDADARRHYAEVLIHRGATSEALLHLEQAARLSPHDASYTIRAGEIYLAQGQLERAAQLANRAINMDQTAADGWALRGRVQLARNRPREALGDLQRALGYRPDDARLLEDVARLYLALDRPARALLYLDTVADSFVVGEEPIDLLVLQASTYAALGRHDDAARRYGMACSKAQPDAELQFRLAEAEWNAGRTNEAADAARTALQIQPQHLPSRQLLERLSQVVPASGTIR